MLFARLRINPVTDGLVVVLDTSVQVGQFSIELARVFTIATSTGFDLLAYQFFQNGNTLRGADLVVDEF
ncbi:MAG: hypothetical protein A2284_02020 [Deltaproteobacteria bacterium RIFOXYA12_FULL_61_11]|nr:MAG: hypothetical protein A2284_02020 [Deltaproteobacteria bacterium RIFOXYA12_FULL_61_11]